MSDTYNDPTSAPPPSTDPTPVTADPPPSTDPTPVTADPPATKTDPAPAAPADFVDHATVDQAVVQDFTPVTTAVDPTPTPTQVSAAASADSAIATDVALLGGADVVAAAATSTAVDSAPAVVSTTAPTTASADSPYNSYPKPTTAVDPAPAATPTAADPAPAPLVVSAAPDTGLSTGSTLTTTTITAVPESAPDGATGDAVTTQTTAVPITPAAPVVYSDSTNGVLTPTSAVTTGEEASPKTVTDGKAYGWDDKSSTEKLIVIIIGFVLFLCVLFAIFHK